MHPAYRPEIDGLRALAVVSVFLFHLEPAWLPGGFIGVDIFFVISGYLITTIISKELVSSEFSFARFYARRAKRIFPALFAMLAITGFFAFISLPPEEYKEFLKAMRYGFLQLSNLYFAQEVDYFAQGLHPSPLLHTWSLGVEEQYYLLWPLMLAVVYKMVAKKFLAPLFMLVLLASLWVSEWLLSVNAMHSYYMVYSRAWELLIGGALAFGILPDIRSRQAADWASLAALLAMLAPMMMYVEQDFPGTKAVLPVVGAALFIHSANHCKGIAHKLLSAKPVLAIGVCSYSLYLWHWPLIAFTRSITDPALTGFGITLIVFGCFALGALSYKYVEQPFVKLKVRSGRVISASLCVILCGVLVTNIVKRYDYHSARSSYRFDPEEVSSIDTKALCAGEFKETCTARADGTFDIILAGDSHAQHYAPLILSWARGSDYRVKIVAKGGCAPWIKSNAKEDAEDPEECLNKKTEFKRALDQFQGRIFLAIRGDRLEESYGVQSVDEIRAIVLKELQSKKVTLMLQVPMLNKNPLNCWFKQQSTLMRMIKPFYTASDDCLEGLVTVNPEQSNQIIKQYAESMGWATYSPAPLNNALKNPKGKLLYRDMDHINVYGSRYLAQHFEGVMATAHALPARPPAITR